MTLAPRWVRVAISEGSEVSEVSFSHERRRRPGSSRRYRPKERAVLHVSAEVDAAILAYDTRADGCFPLITNDEVMTPAEMLFACRCQPNLSLGATTC